MHLIPAKGTELVRANWIKTRVTTCLAIIYNVEIWWCSSSLICQIWQLQLQMSLQKISFPSYWLTAAQCICMHKSILHANTSDKKESVSAKILDLQHGKRCKNWFVSLLSFASLTIKIANKKRGIQFNKVLWKR